MLNFLHGYTPELLRGYIKHGLFRKGDGIRFVQNLFTPDEFSFNRLAAKDSELYSFIKENNCPFYIDRLQGGLIIYDYDFDKALLDDYRSMLGDKFLGFQMHEWLSNYKSDQRKCADVSADEWTRENIAAAIKKAYPCKHLLLEAMTMQEMLEYGKPQSAQQFYDNMTSIYKKRVAKYKDLVPCDSGMPMYPFEAENGAKVIMPEVGAAGYEGIIIMMSFARAVCASYNIKLGAYYECWGGEPFSVCTYFPGNKNEWYQPEDEDEFPFHFAGPGGGSSRSAQWRVYLYSYLSGAQYISEEWGAFNTFSDESCETLSEYGLVKKKFIEFLEKYPDIGEKVAPIALVLSNSFPTYVVGNKTSYSGDYDDELYGYPLPEDEAVKMRLVRSSIREVFLNTCEMLGNEKTGLINMVLPDAVDILNYHDGKALERYDYLVDLTSEDGLIDKGRCISVDTIGEKLRELLPIRVEGGLHHIINKKVGGGYYLTIFNNSGIYRSVEGGETKLPEATKTVEITLNDSFGISELRMLEGDGVLERTGKGYACTLEAGGWSLIEVRV